MDGTDGFKGEPEADGPLVLPRSRLLAPSLRKVEKMTAPNLPMLLLGVALVYGAGILTGFNLARRITGFMLGGRRS
jgi:hypothetical protein